MISYFPSLPRLIGSFPPAREPVWKPRRDLVGVACHVQVRRGRTCRGSNGLVDALSCGVCGLVDSFAGRAGCLVEGVGRLAGALLSCVSG